MLVPLPAGLNPLAVASASDNLTDAWVSTSRPISTRPDARVLVVGGTESLGVELRRSLDRSGYSGKLRIRPDALRLREAGPRGRNVSDPGVT